MGMWQKINHHPAAFLDRHIFLVYPKSGVVFILEKYYNSIMKPIVKKWIEISDYDFKTARAMYRSRRYLYVAFMCQQAVEKILKAFITNVEDEYPPKIHKLETLSLKANLSEELESDQKDLLSELSFYYLNNRYPDFKAELNKLINRKKSHELLKRTEKFLKWMKQKIK